MESKALKIIFGILTTCIAVVLFTNYQQQNNYEVIDRMPLVHDDPYKAMASNAPPVPERGKDVQKWIEPGVKIRVSNAMGSGTIVYYDKSKNLAYVQSCGHLWDGNMSAKEGENRRTTCKVEVFYKNGKKLDKPQSYPANVLWYSNNKNGGGKHLCQDVSLSTFQPDFEPKFFPVGPETTKLQQGEKLHSIGCDSGSEVANYNVRVIGERGNPWPDLVTTENSPRPGRSGGGLINEDGHYVGICWGTSEYSGTGNGFFTPLKTLRHFNKINGFDWLNNVSNVSLARQIPIVDRNNEQGKYLDNYIPMPVQN